MLGAVPHNSCLGGRNNVHNNGITRYSPKMLQPTTRSAPAAANVAPVTRDGVWEGVSQGQDGDPHYMRENKTLHTCTGQLLPCSIAPTLRAR